jgi:hypothetical protein
VKFFLVDDPLVKKVPQHHPCAREVPQVIGLMVIEPLPIRIVEQIGRQSRPRKLKTHVAEPAQPVAFGDGAIQERCIDRGSEHLDRIDLTRFASLRHQALERDHGVRSLPGDRKGFEPDRCDRGGALECCGVGIVRDAIEIANELPEEVVRVEFPDDQLQECASPLKLRRARGKMPKRT